MIKSLHRVERSDPFIHALCGSVGLELDQFDTTMKDFRDQLDISTATWALPVYEREYGIEVNVSKPVEDRRSALLARMRGSGKVGAAEIKLIADSWTNGDVAVTFDGAIQITFTSIFGIPSGIEDLKEEIRKISPAHLPIEYTFLYTAYSDVISTGSTYAELLSVTYEELLNGGLS